MLPQERPRLAFLSSCHCHQVQDTASEKKVAAAGKARAGWGGALGEKSTDRVWENRSPPAGRKRGLQEVPSGLRKGKKWRRPRPGHAPDATPPVSGAPPETRAHPQLKPLSSVLKPAGRPPVPAASPAPRRAGRRARLPLLGFSNVPQPVRAHPYTWALAGSGPWGRPPWDSHRPPGRVCRIGPYLSLGQVQ